MVTVVTVVQNDEQLGGSRVIPVVVLDDAKDADALGDALVKGGLKAIEITLRTAAGLDAIEALAGRDDLLVGAGTVLTAEQADRAIAAGAKFVVTPGFAPKVVAASQDAGVLVIPGIATATEIQMALDAGLDTVKFFPAESLGGAPVIKALAAPYRGVRFVPTGGITPAVMPDYLAIPAVLAVGASWIVAPDLLKAGNWDEVTRRAAAAVEASA